MKLLAYNVTNGQTGRQTARPTDDSNIELRT